MAKKIRNLYLDPKSKIYFFRKTIDKKPVLISLQTKSTWDESQ